MTVAVVSRRRCRGVRLTQVRTDAHAQGALHGLYVLIVMTEQIVEPLVVIELKFQPVVEHGNGPSPHLRHQFDGACERVFDL